MARRPIRRGEVVLASSPECAVLYSGAAARGHCAHCFEPCFFDGQSSEQSYGQRAMQSSEAATAGEVERSLLGLAVAADEEEDEGGKGTNVIQSAM